MHPIEFTWYKFVVLVTSILAIGFGIYNIYYFNKIRTEGNCNPVNNTNATTGLWLNIVLVVFATITLLWSMFRLIFTGETPQPEVNKTYNTMRYENEEPQPLPGSVTQVVKPPQTQVMVIPSPPMSRRIVSVPSPSMMAPTVSIPDIPAPGLLPPSMINVPSPSISVFPTPVIPAYTPSPLPLSSPIIVSTR